MNPHHKRTVVCIAVIFSAGASFGAENTAKPDAALVARFERNVDELSIKLAECKKKNDLAAVLTDVSCMSAQEAFKRREQKMLASKCQTSDTFVYIPPNVKGRDLQPYLLSHAPSVDALQRCNLTKEQWLQRSLEGSRK